MLEQILTLPILAIMTIGLIAWMKEGGYEGHRVDKSGIEDIADKEREIILLIKRIEEDMKKQEEEDNEKNNRQD